jgi:hypothetical protein
MKMIFDCTILACDSRAAASVLSGSRTVSSGSPARTDDEATRRICAGQRDSYVVVVRGGVEPPTFRFSGGRSYQLSYLTVPDIGTRKGPDARLSGPDGI